MNAYQGFGLILLAGLLNGAFALPLKATKKWAWENTWLIYSITGMVVVNWAIVFYTVPDVFSVYADVAPQALKMIIAFGFIWGMANLLFGIGIDLVGISLTFPLCMGLSITFGAIVPPLVQDPNQLKTASGMTMIAGLVIILAGVVVFGLAGAARDAQVARASDAGATTNQKTKKRFLIGVIIALLAGLFDPTLNYALAFGGEVKKIATARGATETSAADAIWALVLIGSFTLNTVYCSYLLFKNRTWSRFVAKGTASHWLLAALMGTIWMTTIALYGRGESGLGAGGAAIAWPTFYGAIIISSTLFGYLSGEWRGGEGRPTRLLVIALTLMLISLGVFAGANKLKAFAESAPVANNAEV